MRVLVIEDQYLDVQALRESVLERYGTEATIVPARDIQTALGLLEHGRWDQVILDLRIDSSDAVETYQKVATAAAPVSVTVWSGGSVPDHVSAGIPVTVHKFNSVEDAMDVAAQAAVTAADAELFRVLHEILTTLALVAERIVEAGALAKEGRDNFLALRDAVQEVDGDLDANSRVIQEAIANNTAVLRELKEWATVISGPVEKVKAYLKAEVEFKQEQRQDALAWREWQKSKVDELLLWLTNNKVLTGALTAAASLTAIGAALWILNQLGVPLNDVLFFVPGINGGGVPPAP